MTSSSSDSSTLDSGPPAPRPAAAGLMKFMFTSGPARQDLSKPLALEDLMVGDVSRLTRRHEDFGGPGLLRSLPAKRVALSRREGAGSADSTNSSSSSDSTDSDSSKSSKSESSSKNLKDSESSSSVGEKGTLGALQTAVSASLTNSQNSRSSALFSTPEAPEELPPELSEGLPEPPNMSAPEEKQE